MKTLPLAHIHHEAQVRMGEFAGWCVPLFYTRIREEYFSCINNWGLFDISHLGKVVVYGPDGANFLDWVSSRTVKGLSVGEGKFSFFLNHRGGIVDGVMVFREAEDQWLILTNAGAREKVVVWLNSLIERKVFAVELNDITENHFLISLQGPKSTSVIERVFSWKINNLRRFRTKKVHFGEYECAITRMSFSCLDGFEIRGEKKLGEQVWRKLLDALSPLEGKLCGFAVRDLLRFEAAFPLYGAEFDDTVNPLELGRPDLIDWEREEFLGYKPLVLERKRGSKKRLVGIEVKGKRIPRYGFPIQNKQDIPCGHITSGNYSFRLRKNLAMGFLGNPYGKLEESVVVSVPRTKVEARIVPLPFIS